MNRIPILLTAYGLPHGMGFLPTRDGASCTAPITPVQLMDAAAELGHAGVEMPIPLPDVMPLEPFRDALAERGMKFVADYMCLLDGTPEEFNAYLRQAAAAGAPLVRAMISRVLCGDRSTLEGGWEARVLAVIDRLRAALPLADDLGLVIALENHQDAACEDFERIADALHQHPAFGVVLDTGNPLAVGEGPAETALRLAPLIRHLHLKDYTIHFAPEGCRLVRCAAGDGVIDFTAILRIVRENGHDLLPGNEIAAQATRTVPLLDDGWWACHSPRKAQSLLPALRILWERGRPAHEPYSSAWERGCDSAAVCAEEWDLVRRSAAHFHRIWPDL